MGRGCRGRGTNFWPQTLGPRPANCDIGTTDHRVDERVFDWEVVERRFLLPSHLCLVLQVDPCLVRMSRAVEQKIRSRHHSVVPVMENLTEALERWEFAGPSRHSEGMFEVLIRDEREQFVVMVVGFDRAGRMNVATMYSARRSSAENRSVSLVQRRRKED